MSILDVVVFFGFIIGVIALGVFKSKNENTQGDEGASEYFLAGRGLTWWLIGISLIAANISAEQFVGMSGSAADYLGLAIASYEWMAAVTLVVVAFAFLPYFLKTGIFTIPQFLENRYNHWARSMMAIFMLIILIFVSLSGVIYAGSLTMMDLLHQSGIIINLTTCCWIMGLIAAAYVAFGGLKACAWADLIQGSALVIAGGIICYLALKHLGLTPGSELVDATGTIAASIGDDVGAVEKFRILNDSKLHMVLPKSDLNIPWTALVVGLWIPNFYYWGLNQYITQRVLGSASLKDGQKGIVFAAALKLVIPFVIVFPGLMAFNMFSTEMADIAANDPSIVMQNDKTLATFEVEKANSESLTFFKYDQGWAGHNAGKVPEVDAHNAAVTANASNTDSPLLEQKLVGYKTDSALGLLIGNLVPKGGLFGFIIAALIGAIISSLAAILNAASTIFTMDIYGRYISRDAAQKTLVTVGRICVGVFVVIGCVVSPQLANPKFGGIFKYIQEFQGYISPGILAVFIFGLLNRRAHGMTGVIGLIVNPVIYGFLARFRPDIAFLDRMAICLFSVLIIMGIIGAFWKLPKKVEFKSNTDLNLESSRPALISGIGVVILTLVLYGIFW
ncbi:MAG: sodium/solute symporter [Gammaproteobacteria bacterium]|nr:sodium/solute symporter [Gammaproteobacteria bacterium]